MCHAIANQSVTYATSLADKAPTFGQMLNGIGRTVSITTVAKAFAMLAASAHQLSPWIHLAVRHYGCANRVRGYQQLLNDPAIKKDTLLLQLQNEQTYIEQQWQKDNNIDQGLMASAFYVISNGVSGATCAIGATSPFVPAMSWEMYLTLAGAVVLLGLSLCAYPELSYRQCDNHLRCIDTLMTQVEQTK